MYVIEDKERRKINKKKGFKYGYDKDLDIVIISKDGTLGEVVEIQGLQIGLPEVVNEVYSISKVEKEQYWMKIPSIDDKLLRKVKTIQEFKTLHKNIQQPWYDYIDNEFDNREDGFWFMNNGEPTYITGSHYMYLQWTKIDAEVTEYREANRIFFLFWEACKADDRCYGMTYLKNRRSGFSYMASGEAVNLTTQNKDWRTGILSKTGDDAKKMFTNKVVRISTGYPFFFRPIQDGMQKPKVELMYQIPSKKLTLKSVTESEIEDNILIGLDSSIDWKTTGDYAYDGEKLGLLVHDESGKWVAPNNIMRNWGVTKTCLRLGSNVVGKCMMGSTSGALEKGGKQFKEMYYDGDLTSASRNRNGQTISGLYSLFIPMEWNYEGYFDRYGYPIFDTPDEPIMNNQGNMVDMGVLEEWENEVDGYKNKSDKLNEHYRQYPRTEAHAFRDEIKNSLFNLTKIYEQIDYNDQLFNKSPVTTGNFIWRNGEKDSVVQWIPSREGNFKLSWVPDFNIANNVIAKNGHLYPGNEDMGAFGCDSYDISGTVGGGGSKGALHGITSFNMMTDVPSLHFFLEYIARPKTAEMFFEDVLKACVYYGMPILIENNKPGLLYHFKRRGYRKFCLDRPDKLKHNLSVAEKELGGIPNSSEFIRQAHADAIASYIEGHVGVNEEGNIGTTYFQETLNDWSRFDFNNRTKHDASISSGLALMAIKKSSYHPRGDAPVERLTLDLKKYNQKGSQSKIINR